MLTEPSVTSVTTLLCGVGYFRKSPVRNLYIHCLGANVTPLPDSVKYGEQEWYSLLAVYIQVCNDE